MVKSLSRMIVLALVAVILLPVMHAQSETGGDMYTHSVTINRSPDDVWAALVSKSAVDGYYFVPISADITGVGQDFYYGTAEQQMITGSVLDLRPPELFKHSFKFAGPDQPDSTVTYALTDSGGGTQVTVTHEGYGRDTQPYADIAGGWPIILEGLKAALEKQ